MKKGEVIVTEVSGQNPDGSQKIEFLARLYVKASRQDCWKIIRDYNRFAEFMPKLRKCTILKREGEVYYVEYEAKVAFINAKYHLRLDGVEQYRRIEFKLDRTKPNSIRDSNGYWLLEDAPDGSGTILNYASNVDTGIPAPESLAKKIGKESLTQVVKNVRMRIESGGTWKKPEGS
jgi:carbon monoxide dehydrogenase subunit G